jgi:hypothetical protein
MIYRGSDNLPSLNKPGDFVTVRCCPLLLVSIQ